MEWGIVVLAAGTSSRMGRPKMTLPWGDSTVLGRVLETLGLAMGGRSAAAVVVTGGDEEAVRAEAARVAAAARGPAVRAAAARPGPAGRGRAGLSVACVRNPDYRSGEMMDSLRVGLAGLPPGVETALVVLGDQPQLSVEAARAVIETAERSASPIVVPACGGRRGHPWALRRRLWEELSRATTARDFLGAHPSEIAECPADETVLKDLDTPGDYEREAPPPRQENS